MVWDPDFDIVRRCQSTEPDVWEQAFEELFGSYRDRVYNTALRVVGNPDDALDVTQEAFVIVFRHIRQFGFESRFFTWLYRIVINLAVDRRKRESGRPVSFSQQKAADRLEPGETTRDSGSVEKSPFEETADREFLERRVQQAIDRLSPKLRAIVVLRYIEGLSYTEVADILRCSLGTVKSRLSRAHRVLQELLEPVWREKGSTS